MLFSRANTIGVAALLCAALGYGAGNARLFDAVSSGNRAAAQALIQQGADVNAAQSDGTTALHWAAQRNDAEMIALLLKAGAKANAANRYGVTPLSEACENSDSPIAGMLLKAGADPNFATPEGQTPLMTAAHSGNLAAATALIAAGAKVNTVEGFRGQTALMWAAATSHPEIVKLLLAHGADPSVHSAVRADPPPGGGGGAPYAHGGMTALSFAARQGDLAAVRILVENHANVNDPDADGLTPLILAVMNTHYETGAYLLDQGADPKIADKDGRTALYAAVDLHAEDSSNMPNRKETDALTNLEMIQLLLAHGADINARLRHSVGQKAYLDGGDGTLGNGTTPFIRAARGGDVPMMQFLVDHGADPKLTLDNKTTALMIAAGIGYREGKTRGTEEEAIAAIQFCLDHGADINAQNVRGDTAVHGAAHRGADHIVRYLAQHGARLDVRNRAGLTPEEIAIGKNQGTATPHETTAALLHQLAASR